MVADKRGTKIDLMSDVTLINFKAMAEYKVWRITWPRGAGIVRSMIEIR